MTFSRNSEAFALKFLENLEEIFLVTHEQMTVFYEFILRPNILTIYLLITIYLLHIIYTVML